MGVGQRFDDLVEQVECRAEAIAPMTPSVRDYARRLYEDPEEADSIAIADRERVPADWSDAEAVDRIAEAIMDQCPEAELIDNNE